MKWSVLITAVVGLGLGLGAGLMLGRGTVHEQGGKESEAPSARHEDKADDKKTDDKKPEGDDAEAKPVCRVRIAPLAHGDLALPIVAFGTVAVAPSGSLQEVAPYECSVTALLVAEGTAVVAGGALMELAPTPDVLAQRDEAQVTLAGAERELALAKQRLELHLATNQELSQAQAAIDLARYKFHTWEQRLAADGRRITATQAGRVSKVLVRVGQQVPVGTPLVELLVGDRSEVHLGLDPTDASHLTPEQPVQVTAVRRSGPSESLTLHLAGFGAQVAPDTGLLDALVPLPAGSGLIPGEVVRGELARTVADVLIVPRAALVPAEHEWVVFTVADHHAVRHVVELRAETRTHAAFASKDLHAGDQVIIEGNGEVSDGMTVEIQDEPKP